MGGGTESTEGVGRQEPPSASNAVGGATYLNFFKENNNTDPAMGAKLKKDTFTKYVFQFFELFRLRVWLQSLQTVMIWQTKFFFEKSGNV